MKKTSVFAAFLILLISSSVYADIIIGPSPPTITSTINVNTDITYIVGNTIVNTTATPTLSATNITNFSLTLNSLLGPTPGTILIQALNGNAIQANGGQINASGVTAQTQGGHTVLANGVASNVILNGVNLSTTGTGSGLAAIGGTINATNTIINNTSTPTVSAGHGAIAESAGTVILGNNVSIATGAFNSVGLGASGAGSQVIANFNPTINLNGRGAMGIYLHDGDQVVLNPNATLQINASSSVGVAVDNTVVSLGAPGIGIGKGLKINLNGIPTAGQAASTGIVAFNDGNISLEQVTVQGAGSAAGAWARPGSTINLSGGSLININANSNPTYYTLQTP